MHGKAKKDGAAHGCSTRRVSVRPRFVMAKRGLIKSCRTRFFPSMHVMHRTPMHRTASLRQCLARTGKCSIWSRRTLHRFVAAWLRCCFAASDTSIGALELLLHPARCTLLRAMAPLIRHLCDVEFPRGKYWRDAKQTAFQSALDPPRHLPTPDSWSLL
ncbi:hypothetical protein BCV70DRAFT_91271 [Testicularia cyperi]|uniref:Uncharacterized protein n=1 Tax=Testicularia cyperi TaxID=1882483 RepID=A0A317XS89_9BASI|nr:hypothetical protein BCV70DRAFT_91271 [Testicularia cyperi]